MSELRFQTSETVSCRKSLGNYVKNLKGPFNNADFIAVGGVTKDNILSFFKMGYLGVGMGSSLIKTDFLKNNDWNSLDKHIKDTLKAIDEFL